MNLYRFKDIIESVTCEQYLATRGVSLAAGNRCNAFWRGGDGMNVHCDGSTFFDHRMKTGGSVIDLCCLCEGLDKQQAAQRLGDLFSVNPRATVQKNKRPRYDELIEEGYTISAQYDYKDEQDTLIYSVIRLQKGDTKEFLQRTPSGWGLRSDTRRLLYNLNAVIGSQLVFIVEGEKDVATLAGWGLVGTTNSGGAGNWESCTNQYLAGKDIIMLADNDKAGQNHAEIVRMNVQARAKSFKIITLSGMVKGDVTDWATLEDGTKEKLLALIANPDPTDEQTQSEELAAAKKENATPFSNYIENESRMVGSSTHKRKQQLPVQIRELVAMSKRRFLNFPRRIGESLFDWNKDANKIVFINNTNALFAWIQRLSGHPVLWSGAEGMVRREELFEGINQEALHYESIGSAPHYPTCDNVFYVHAKLPKPDPTGAKFYELLEFFLPSSDEYRTILRVLFLAPLYRRCPGNKPAWIIDSTGGQGAGKTSLVKMLARLYREDYIDIDIRELNKDYDSVAKRLVSADGRTKRIALYDNVTGVIKCDNLSKLITASSISTRGAYSKNEDTRPNDITHIITTNGATSDTDIARRAFVIKLSPAPRDPKWEVNVDSFIEAHRLQIYADMLHIIENNPITLKQGRTRYPDFETSVMTAACSSMEEYTAMMDQIKKDAEGINMESDNAGEFLELFTEKVLSSTDIPTNALSLPIFVETSVIDKWLSKSSGALKDAKTSQVRQLVMNDTMKGFSKYVERLPPDGCTDSMIPQQKRGLLYIGNNKLVKGVPQSVSFTKLSKSQKLEHVATITFTPTHTEG